MEIRPCFVEINLNVIEKNFKNIKKYSKKEVIAVVKANAYGHGAVEISKVVLDNGASILAVATVEEAMELRSFFYNTPILILGPVADYQKRYCIENSIAIIASSLEEVSFIDKLSKEVNKKAIVHLAIDTGMSRVGYLAHSKDISIVEDVCKMLDHSNIHFEGIFTHFSCADDESKDFTYKQYDRFRFLVKNLKSIGFDFKYVHCENSAAIVFLEDDICNCVRAGISLYGYYPSDYIERNLNVSPALSWKCRISHIKELKKDTAIGYGATYTTSSDSVIATIPVGYADGFRRSLSNVYRVIINGKTAPIVGNVCMDQTMIDVSGIDCKLGDIVTLMSKENSAEDMAYIDNTISYEILCGISSRVPRIYVTDGLKTNN